ncbi:MAG: M23 family metallopeptidase [Bosea sp. (in: a-proteobacteria)]
MSSRIAYSSRTNKLSVRRSSIVIGSLLLVGVSAWAGVASWFIFARDDLAARMIRRETARQYAYEDRIAHLRQEIDRLSSRQLLDQDSVEYRLSELVSRQTQLESRQSIVATIATQMNTMPAQATARVNPNTTPVGASALGFAPIIPGQSAGRPVPMPEPPALRGAERPLPGSLQQGSLSQGSLQSWQSSALPQARTVSEILGHVQSSIAQVEASQIASLSRFDAGLHETGAALRAVVNDVGLNPDRIATSAASRAQGGPFIPLAVDPKAGPFEATLSRLQPQIMQIERLRSAVASLPLRRPMPDTSEMTSNFGYRLDPFTRGPAMHSGIDFRAEHGTPVRAASVGRVITAEYSGGYGNMVEIDHGNGLSTRYGHLSAILVEEGQTIASGTVIGRVGSTGRSTGPHLHYETRLDGDAIDPARFLRAGQKLMARAPHLLNAPVKTPLVQANAN